MKKIPQLDGLRGIAVLMVFAYHALHVPFLWAGVDLFFAQRIPDHGYSLIVIIFGSTLVWALV